jgi:hypothetical protein
MASLGYDDVRELRRRFSAGETDIDTEARRHSLEELAATLRHTRARLQAIADTWTDEQLSIRPPDGEGEDRWSASEAITHLIATENWYLLHMTRLLGRREPFDVMVRGLGDLARNGVPAAQLSAELRQATERLLSEIAAIGPDADLDAVRPSVYFGDLSLRGWVLLAVAHDVDHYEQIERLTGSAGLPLLA